MQQQERQFAKQIGCLLRIGTELGVTLTVLLQGGIKVSGYVKRRLNCSDSLQIVDGPQHSSFAKVQVAAKGLIIHGVPRIAEGVVSSWVMVWLRSAAIA